MSKDPHLQKELETYGWNPHFQTLLTPKDESVHQIARVIQEHKEAYLVHAMGEGIGNIWAEISGKMRHEGTVRADFPAVGDWVLLRGLENIAHQPARLPTAGPVQITRILPRKTVLARRLEGKREGGAGGDEQVLAVNVDLAFLGTSLNENFNLRRLERYLALARDAGVQPVVLLTKADLCKDAAPFVEQVRAIAGPQAAIHAISVLSGQGMDDVRAHLLPGITAVILGSSGIGKSTLVNHLAQADIQDMMEIRDTDDKGRHCTTFRHLVRTATGGLIIDTPGLRGLSVGESTDALLAAFTDIDTLASTCRFTNCRHETEPGCAIKQGLETGAIDPTRLESYFKMQREITAHGRRENRVLGRKQKKMEKRATAHVNKKIKRKWEH